MCENLRCSCCSARELSFQASVSGLNGALLRVLFDALLDVFWVQFELYLMRPLGRAEGCAVQCNFAAYLSLSVRTSAQATLAMSR